MQVKVRPYIWESANRPLYVRSVWLDNEGHRHVLLNEEVRKRNQTRSIRRIQTERASSIEDLQCVGISDIGINGRELHPSSTGEKKGVTKKFDRSMGKLRACRKICEKNENINFVSLKHQLTRQKSRKKSVYDTKEPDNEPKIVVTEKIAKEDESHKNQLTERVLNWLDKTGKFTSYSPKAVKKAKPTLPIIHVKDNDGDEDWDTAENFEFAKKVMSAENIMKPRVKTAIPLKRSESVHTLSLTFDDEELAPNPYGISRCRSAALRFGDFFPATYKCSKKFLSLCSRKTSASSASAQSLNNTRVSPPLTSASANNLTNLNELPETSRMANSNSIVISLNNLDLNKLEETTGNRNSQNNTTTAGMEINNNVTTTGGGGGGGGSSRRRKILRRKDTLIENQYKHIIHKHILETQCNTQIVKRQMHIFIPKIPKRDRPLEQELQPPTKDAADCDSCLSTVFSEAN